MNASREQGSTNPDEARVIKPLQDSFIHGVQSVDRDLLVPTGARVGWSPLGWPRAPSRRVSKALGEGAEIRSTYAIPRSSAAH